ncbi:hypothetical protein AQ490_03655 [Wenjunlia vitaminophila]|uniref:J domain-containing protein n=1 Tax=Wenjunlia vitaminophila TaxID=76728 RepID=A0A0T6LT86_WENVI|nr:hypothetical protein [Wenjunlia vitaminophila]KRV49299.1 hypothetical protein AQ490_03655 [Wenjunlia vitaminophila]
MTGRAPGPDGTAERARRRQEYRAFVRDCHPDRGGDPELFVAGLRHWRAVLAEPARVPGPSPAGEDHATGSRAGPRGRGPVPGEPRVTAYRRGSWPVRCGRALAAALRRRRRTRVR